MRMPVQWCMGLAAAALVALPYLPGLRYGMVYDDHASIGENSFLADPAHAARAAALRTLTDDTVPDGRRPVVLLSYFMDRALWGGRFAGYHITSLACHMAVAALLLAFARRRLTGFETPFAGFLLLLLLGWHPALTEAVQSPAFREDLLAAFFLLLFLLAATSRRRWRFLAPLALAAALLSKESAAAGPALLLWYWCCFPERVRSWPRAAGAALAAAVPVILLALLWWHAGNAQAWGDERTGYALAFPSNLLTAPWLWIQAVRLLFAPWPLTVDYAVGPVTSLADPRWLAGAAALAGWVALALWLRPRAPVIAWAAGWIPLSLLPVSNLVPLFNPFAERYLYLAAAGWALGMTAVLARRPITSRRLALAGALVAVFGGLTMARVRDWRDDFTLWSATLRVEPRSARALVGLGLEYKHQGNRARARACFEQAERIQPGDISGLLNLAIMSGEDGDLAGAERRLRQALGRRPRSALARWNLSVALMRQGRLAEASAELEETLRLDPFLVPALHARTILRMEQGDLAGAARALEAWLRAAPRSPEAGAVRHQLEAALAPSAALPRAAGSRY